MKLLWSIGGNYFDFKRDVLLTYCIVTWNNSHIYVDEIRDNGGESVSIYMYKAGVGLVRIGSLSKKDIERVDVLERW